MGIPEGGHWQDQEEYGRWKKSYDDRRETEEDERWIEPDVEVQRQALGDGGPGGRAKQIIVFSAWMERHLQRSRERHGDPFTKLPFKEVKKPQKS
jgi:hypothetical protein